MKNEDWLNLVMCACLSVLGGVGQLLSVKNKKSVALTELGRNSIVSLSIGIGIFVIMYAFVPSARENSFVVFAAGYCIGWGGPWFMNSIVAKIASEKGIKKEDEQ